LHSEKAVVYIGDQRPVATHLIHKNSPQAELFQEIRILGKINSGSFHSVQNYEELKKPHYFG
jgi:hypothetical protein